MTPWTHPTGTWQLRKLRSPTVRTPHTQVSWDWLPHAMAPGRYAIDMQCSMGAEVTKNWNILKPSDELRELASRYIKMLYVSLLVPKNYSFFMLFRQIHCLKQSSSHTSRHDRGGGGVFRCGRWIMLNHSEHEIRDDTSVAWQILTNFDAQNQCAFARPTRSPNSLWERSTWNSEPRCHDARVSHGAPAWFSKRFVTPLGSHWE